MNLSISWDKPVILCLASYNRWCTAIKSKMLFLSYLVSRITKIQLSQELLWIHWENFRASRVSQVLPVKILLCSSKIFSLISQLESTSENSSTPSYKLSRLIQEMVATKRRESLLKISHKWLTTTHQVTSRFSSRKFGSHLSIDGLCLIAMVPPRSTWMNSLKLRVTGKLFKLSTTPSINQRWKTQRDRDKETSISTT